MARIGAGRGRVKFSDPFFRWLRDHMLMVEEYAYACTDFIGDLDLPLPPGGQWGDIGKKQETLKMEFFLCFLCFISFMISDETYLSSCRCWSSKAWRSISVRQARSSLLRATG